MSEIKQCAKCGGRLVLFFGASESYWQHEGGSWDCPKFPARELDINEARQRAEAALKIVERINGARDPVVKAGASHILATNNVPALATDLLQALEEIERLRAQQ